MKSNDAQPPGDCTSLDSPLPLERTEAGVGVSMAEEALRFRALLLGDSRSATLANLFDYLLDRSNDARAPKEIEVAIAVFGKNGTFDTSQNSMVRGHMHRLRQRLDKFNGGKSGPRLTIPKGEYRLTLSDAPEQEEESEEALPRPPVSAWMRLKTKRTIGILVSANVCLWALVFTMDSNWRSSSSLAQTVLWKPVMANGKALVIAVGDFYLVGRSGGDGVMERLTFNRTIQSGTDLASYLMRHPDQSGKLHDRDIYRVPAREAKAAMEMLNLISGMHPRADSAEITQVSRISQDRVDSSNIIYIQYFSQLGSLRSPLLQMSGFALTDDFNQIRDVASGRIFQARSSVDVPTNGSGSAHSYSYDYGYIASFPGSSGNHNILISGINDAGLSQMVKLASDRRQLDDLARRIGEKRPFEALYQIRTIGGLVFDTTLLIVRPLKTDAVKSSTR